MIEVLECPLCKGEGTTIEGVDFVPPYGNQPSYYKSSYNKVCRCCGGAGVVHEKRLRIFRQRGY